MTGIARRARPLLGTLVEIGMPAYQGALDARFEAGFAAIEQVQRSMSRFDPDSDIGRFNALPIGAVIEIHADTAEVLAMARRLHRQSDGAFDIAAGHARAWRLDGCRLIKQFDQPIDLGGIAKGYAVDRAACALRAAGIASAWINAGGDVAVFGALDLPILLRDEMRGGARPFATLRNGCFATSHYGPTSRSRLYAPAAPADLARHVSVAAPTALLADALTKVVAATGDVGHPLLSRHQAQAWLH